MLMWGMNLSALKVLVDAIDPVMLTGVRVFVAGVAVLAICKFMGILRLPLKHEWLIIIYISIFNVVLHHSFVAIGLNMTSGVNGALILGLMPLVTVMMTVVILRQKVSSLRTLGFLLGFAGIAVTTLTGEEGLAGISLGDFIVLLGVLVQGFSFVLISKLQPASDPRLITGYMFILGSIFVFLFSQTLGSDIAELGKLVDWHLGFVFLFSAVAATAFGHMSYNYAIRKVGPAESAVFINLNTLFAILGASLFLGDVITFYHLIGFMLILTGVFLGTGSLEHMLHKRKMKNV